jgi:hypothetical protein
MVFHESNVLLSGMCIPSCMESTPQDCKFSWGTRRGNIAYSVCLSGVDTSSPLTHRCERLSLRVPKSYWVVGGGQVTHSEHLVLFLCMGACLPLCHMWKSVELPFYFLSILVCHQRKLLFPTCLAMGRATLNQLHGPKTLPPAWTVTAKPESPEAKAASPEDEAEGQEAKRW